MWVFFLVFFYITEGESSVLFRVGGTIDLISAGQGKNKVQGVADFPIFVKLFFIFSDNWMNDGNVVYI